MANQIEQGQTGDAEKLSFEERREQIHKLMQEYKTALLSSPEFMSALGTQFFNRDNNNVGQAEYDHFDTITFTRGDHEYEVEHLAPAYMQSAEDLNISRKLTGDDSGDFKSINLQRYPRPIGFGDSFWYQERKGEVSISELNNPLALQRVNEFLAGFTGHF